MCWRVVLYFQRILAAHLSSSKSACNQNRVTKYTKGHLFIIVFLAYPHYTWQNKISGISGPRSMTDVLILRGVVRRHRDKRIIFVVCVTSTVGRRLVRIPRCLARTVFAQSPHLTSLNIWTQYRLTSPLCLSPTVPKSACSE